MQNLELHLFLWLTTLTSSSEGQALLTATLTLRDHRYPLYVGEDVTLICTIEGSDTGLTYYWMKDDQRNWRKTNQNTMTLQSVTKSDSGWYQCTAYRDDYPTPVPVSTDSNVVILSIRDYLKATLRLKDQRYPLYVGEDVTLICSIEGYYARWTYYWTKGHQTDWRKSIKNTMTIPSVTESDSGQYQCTAYKDGPTSFPVSTDSNVVKLRVLAIQYRQSGSR
ncbi:hemolin-like [Polypterus senegalus]|uniref:hemolin-like n=1 Tax=Polypterus senegalus TaxID=55291 RepID=UPI001965B73F|nr:hemolin-like [Polypterus senegalus]